MTFDPTELKRLHEAATPGEWEWWTSNSRRRLRSQQGGRDRSKFTGDVLTPTIERDGHPDLNVSEADMAIIVYLRNHAEEIAAGMSRLWAYWTKSLTMRKYEQ